MTRYVTPAGGNVFADLGFEVEEAENLKIRSELMAAIKRVIRQKDLTQTAAAVLFRTTQPRISELVRGHIDQFTIDALVNMLGHAGYRPALVVPELS